MFTITDKSPREVAEIAAWSVRLGPGTWTLDPAEGTLTANLDRQCATVGLALPHDFMWYHTYTDVSRTLGAVSRTGCYSTGSQQPTPGPGEQGAFLLRFLNDQQDGILWYLGAK